MLDNVFYINLDHRVDRRKHVEDQLASLGWTKYTRLPAVRCKDGRVGCSMSHLKLLKMAKQRDLDYIVILEDDITFTKPDLYNQMLSQFLEMGLEYDVLLLAGNIRPPLHYVKKFVRRVEKSYTTTGYVVRKHYYDTLIDNIKSGIRRLLASPHSHGQNAIDTHWFPLQKRDTWLIFSPRTVTQLADYSDIEGRRVDYEHVMLDKS